MKKSILGRVGLLALTLTLATTSLMSGTLAKYTSVANVTGKALVAKWDASLNTGLTVDFNLRETLVTPSSSALADGKKVVAEKIAPGMSGSIPIVISKGESDVGVHYEISISRYVADPDASLPNIKFTSSEAVKSVSLSELTNNNADFTDTNVVWKQVDSGTIDANATGGEATKAVNLEWEWPYTDNSSPQVADADDTMAGKAAAEIKFRIRVVMTQVAIP